MRSAHLAFYKPFMSPWSQSTEFEQKMLQNPKPALYLFTHMEGQPWRTSTWASIGGQWERKEWVSLHGFMQLSSFVTPCGQAGCQDLGCSDTLVLASGLALQAYLLGHAWAAILDALLLYNPMAWKHSKEQQQLKFGSSYGLLRLKCDGTF